MDLSRLSNDDLAAIANNDLSKVSDKGLNYIIEQDKLEKELATIKPDTGFTGAFKAGKERLKGDIAAVAGRTGIMNTEAAEQYKAQKERLAQRMFTPTEESFAEAPFTKFKELLGGSLPYAAAPLAIGAAAATLPVSAPVATGIGLTGAGLASLTQFTGSNLSRQMQEDPNLRLADTSLSSAAAAAAPQAALDVVSFRMMPGIGKIFGAAGKPITPEIAQKIAEQGIIRTTGAYGAGALKTAGIEGTTEAGQQFLERLQAGLNLTDQQARDEYFDSFIGGAVLGGTLGVPGTYLERGRTIRQGAEMEEEQKKQAIIDRQKAQREAALAEKQQLEQTAQNLGVPATLALPAPEQRIEMPEIVDPLIDPLGRFKSTDLSAKEVAEVNKRRIEMGKPRIGKTFSIEDLADVFKPEEAVAAEGVLNRLIASRTGYTPDQNIPAQTLTAAAQQRGIDTTTQGFNDFLIRTTGTDNLGAMSPPQRLAVAQAIQNVKPGDETRILEAGLTNAKYYTPEQYNDTLRGLSKEFKEMGNQENGVTSVLKQIEKYSGLKQEKDQRRILNQAVKDGLLERNVKLSSTGSTIETFKPATDMQPLPGGMDIRKETFKQGDVPESYELRSGARVLTSRETQEEADRDAAAFEQSRQAEVVRLEKEVQRLQKAVAARNAELTQMQALGQDQTNEFFIKSANYYGQDQVANGTIADLRQQQQGFADPVQIVPVGTKPVAKDSFTFYEKNKPQVRFDTEEQAEQYGISRLNDETLQQIVDAAASQKQTGRVKRYTDLAQKELNERQSIEPARGIAITTTKGLKGSKERLESLGIYSKEVQDNLEKLRQSLLPALKRFGLEKVALRVLDSIENGTADGYYVKQIMAIAMDSKDPMGTLRHESIHALKELGAFTDQEWKVLTNKAKSEWVQKFIKDKNLYDAYKDRYQTDNGNLSGFDEYIYEEAIAEAFRNFKPGNLPAGMIGNIWVRLNKLLEALRNAFQKLGFQTTDDIFTRVEEGKQKPTKDVVSGETKLSFRPQDVSKIEAGLEGYLTQQEEKLLQNYIYNNRGRNELGKSLEGNDAYQDALQQNLDAVGMPDTVTMYRGRDTRKNWADSQGEYLNASLSKRLAENFRKASMTDQSNWTVDKFLVPKNAIIGLGHTEEQEFLVNMNKGVEIVGITAKPEVIENEQFSKDAVETNNWKASPVAKSMAEDYAVENDITPYLSEGQISVPVDLVKYSIKPPSDDSSKNDPTTGLFLNKNGSVTLYYPTTAAEARRINNEKKIVPSNPKISSIYLTNESSGWKSLGRMGDEYQVTDGSVVRVEIDPSLLQIAQEYEDGRKEFYVPVKEGEYFNNKMRMWAMYAERSKPIPLATKYSELGTAFERSLNAFKQLNEAEKRARTKEVREILKREHNVGKLLGENGKLEKTRVGDYGITYDDKSVASLGLGLASAQKLNDKTSTCPVSAICEGLCLGDTSGNNMMYGGMASGELAKSLEKTSFRAGPRLSQYLKTEAMMVHPEEFVLLLDKEIKAFKRWADKNEYLPAIRLNVTSDIPPKYLKPIMDANPEVIFYDYTKLDSSPVADNHHLTYSSTGVSQIVNGDQVINKEQNWDRMKRLLDKGSNVAMAFTSKSDMPSVVVDEASGKEYQVWNGDNYDARFLDPKRDDGVGMIVGLTNKAATLKAPTAAKETNGFFIDYDKARDGDRVVIQDQSKFTGSKVIPITKIAVEPKKFAIRAPETKEFKEFFKGSKIVNEDGSPKLMYHGTARDITEFKPKQANAIFLTDDPAFAKNFADSSIDYIVYETFQNLPFETQEKVIKDAVNLAVKNGTLSKGDARFAKQTALTGGDLRKYGIQWHLKKFMRPYLTTGENIIPVFVKSKKPFDYENYDVDGLDALLNKDNSFSDTDLLEISAGSWKKIESPKVQERIKSLGFDGFYVKESFNKNLAVYEPNQVKSAFNVAPTESPDIRYALREFKMSDLPESGTYTLKAGTEIFHGAHKARAEEIEKGGKTLLLPSKVKQKSGGGNLYEGNLIWFGDKDLATGHSKSAVDVSKARYDAENGISREAGKAFSTVTDRDYNLLNIWNYKLSQEEADQLNDVLGLPAYKSVGEGDSPYSAAYRAHTNGENVNRYQVERAGEFSDGLAMTAKALGYDGVFDTSGIAFTAENGIRLGDEATPMQRFSLRQPSAWYYSQLERGIESAPDRIFGKAPQVKAWLTSNASKMGVKSEELQFSGINDFLELKGNEKVSKDEILNYLQQGGVRLEEVMKSEEKEETKYQQWQLDGGTNYQEMLITLPEKQILSNWEIVKNNPNKEEYSLYSSTLQDYALGEDNRTVKVWNSAEEAQDAIKDYAPTQDADPDSPRYKSPHWREENILAHIRMNDRKDRDGAKVLFIEEIQSDWHQAGRKKGYKSNKSIKKEFDDFNSEIKKQVHDKYVAMYKEEYESEPGLRKALKDMPIDEFVEKAANTYAATNFKNDYDYALDIGKGEEWYRLYDQLKDESKAVLDAPFKDTKAWTGLALKRIISYAVENGYDKVAFINGTQSADRYDLSVHLDKIIYSKNDDGTYDVDAIKNDNSIFNRDSQTLEDIEETFGKEVATKVKDGVDSSLTKEQAKEQIDKAISTWEEKAKRGELGVYEDGEIEQIVELMRNDPGGYSGTLRDVSGLTRDVFDKYQGRGYRKNKELSGMDIKAGGRGMINYYDNILPQVASDVLKKIGGGNLEKVIVPVRIAIRGNQEFTYSVVSDLTGEMRSAINNAYVRNNKTGERVTESMNYDDAKDWARSNDPVTSNPQTGFTITEKIREKVGEGIPLFSLRSQLSDSLNNRIGATTTKRKQAGFVERLMDAISPTAITAIRQGLVNKYESIELLSRLRGEQFGEDQLLAETSAIAAALQSDRAAGVAASSFRDGVPVFDKGYTYVSDMDGKVKGLIPILEPLMKYNDPYIFQTFQFYAGTRRGRRLDAEGREKTFTKEDIEAGKELEKQFPEFATVFDEYQKYNAGLVKYMMDTGVISPQEAKIWTQNWDYIPFYRQLDGEKTAGPKVFSPIAGVAKPKKLKGSEAPLDDFMETIVRNARAAIEAGMKNEAARRVIRDVVDFDLGEKLAGPQSGNDIVTVKENGMTVYYRVADPLLVESLKGLNLPQLPFMSFLSAPADLLRNFVTKDPGFILANLGRDSMQAWITSGTNMTPLVDTFKQFGKGLLNYSPEAYALAKSGLTGYDFAGDVESTAKKVEQELRKRTGTRTKGEVALLPITKFWDMLGEASTASDMATRAEVYKRTLERTGSEAEAFYQAMEVINFSRKGNSALIRILSATIPFFNARVQGLDVLYRTGFGKAAMANKDKIQKAFIFRSMVLLGTSVMYWAMVSDDEEYKRLSEEERDNYWIIPGIRIDDKPFRFPIPFELGVLFKVLPERALEYSFGTDTGKDLRKSLLRNAMSTLSFNPIPQAVLPIVENVTNYSFFTGEPVIGRGVQGLAPPYQYGAGTSVLAKQMGEALNYSPQKIDNLIRGYTGTLGTYAMMMLDSALEQEGDPPRAAKRMEQMPIIKRFFASNTGTVSAYYDLKEEVDTVVTTVNMLQRTGNSEDLKTYLEENKKLYGLKSYVATLDKNMKQLNQATRLINASKTMSSEEKREALDKINDAKIKLTERVKLLRKGYE